MGKIFLDSAEEIGAGFAENSEGADKKGFAFRVDGMAGFARGVNPCRFPTSVFSASSESPAIPVSGPLAISPGDSTSRVSRIHRGQTRHRSPIHFRAFSFGVPDHSRGFIVPRLSVFRIKRLTLCAPTRNYRAHFPNNHHGPAKKQNRKASSSCQLSRAPEGEGEGSRCGRCQGKGPAPGGEEEGCGSRQVVHTPARSRILSRHRESDDALPASRCA